MSIVADFPSWIGGAVSYTNHGTGANLNITTSVSIDFWVRLRQFSTTGYNWIFYRGTVNGYGFGLESNLITPGKNIVNMTKFGVSNIPSTEDIVSGTPVHVAITYNSVTSDVIFYRNGVAILTFNDPFATVSPGAVVAYIGSTVASQGINGYLYCLNIYNRVLSPAEVLYNKEHPNNAIRNGRQLGLTQESWMGGVWKDLSPNAYDGTPTGVVLNSSNNLAGRNASL